MTTKTKRNANHLINEKSPYLLQHAFNPVNWYPWNKEVFKKAKNKDKPIFLSIGYSTCHWCHVMAHESFEDFEVARLINDTFLAIKVDREERPDIDNIYMDVCQLITGSGGWPLTIFMTADKKPFYAATYLPKDSHYNRIGLLELIPKIKELWKNKKNELLNSADKVSGILVEKNKIGIKKELNSNILAKTYQILESHFDEEYGGIGIKPKFPTPQQYSYLLRYWYSTNKERALEISEKSLLAMRAGGIYDHLGYGFHRYATDRKWLLPHFEKMLYDQAMIVYTLVELYQINSSNIYARTIKEIIDYLKGKMLAAEGAFYSAEDADSEGEEGKYYLWFEEELKDILGENSSEFLDIYQIKTDGNFHEESTGLKTGRNILHLANPLTNDSVFKEIDKFTEEREKLLSSREERVPPEKDDKILTDCNGLIIAALARAGFVLKRVEYINLAKGAADFILEKLYQDEELLHRYRSGDSSLRANIDDYAFLIWGLIELYNSTFDSQYLESTLKLNKKMIKLFWDNQDGGFFFTVENNQDLILRSKEIYDGAVPSGNSIALWNLIRLSHITGNKDYEKKAYSLINCFAEKVEENPAAYCQFLIAFNSLQESYFDLVIVGEKKDRNTQEILDYFRNNYFPNLQIILKESNRDKINEFAPFIKEYEKKNGQTTIYLCKDYSCKLPTNKLADIKEILNN
ncbi:thioredoxin domain-containing protein [Halocella sp. SP3-1]|uniref:thioredoxin domain-containing protein n=1 Tax=Halocella sp. SP3-1 TaxID=2382161 RepID=UPI000F74C97A|nr:thioredoxin domain-containing protein [Halocella sp. SP3-1]AZO95406.1 thioredoxin domain-containing protein [Halocella sp. SP3-1]